MSARVREGGERTLKTIQRRKKEQSDSERVDSKRAKRAEGFGEPEARGSELVKD